jgi:hypothetical protein
MLDEQTVAADSTPAEITVPTKTRNPNEVIWYGIVPDTTNPIRLVKSGETQGQLIPAQTEPAAMVWGPYYLANVLNGSAPSALHAASSTPIQVVVYRSG